MLKLHFLFVVGTETKSVFWGKLCRVCLKQLLWKVVAWTSWVDGMFISALLSHLDVKSMQLP